jgi:hypothetical protein
MHLHATTATRSPMRAAKKETPARPPFVHRVATARAKYVFDVHTGNIVRVDDTLWDVLPDVGRLTDDDVVARWTAQHPPQDVRRALAEIRVAQRERQLFLDLRPDEAVVPHDDQARTAHPERH